MTNNSAPLRAGVIGLGGWAGIQHAEAYTALPGTDLVAIASVEVDQLTEVADRLGAPKRFTDWRPLVDDPDIDIISIAAPNVLHHEIAIEAMKRGKHVLCEKPMAIDGTRAAAMVAAARTYDRVLMTTFNHRRRGEVTVMRQFIADGGIGRPYHAEARWLRRRHPIADTWFTRKAMSGGGPLIDLGVHMLDLVMYLLGDPDVERASGFTHAELVPASIAAAGGDPASYEVEDFGGGLLRVAGGLSLFFEAAWALHAPIPENEMAVRIHGTDGAVSLVVEDFGRPGLVQFSTDVGGQPAEIIPVVPTHGGHIDVVSDFLAAIASGQWSRHRGVVGLRRSRVLDALLASAEKGTEIAVVHEAEG